jgi:exodeoxyribonuclease V alpha subunit
MPVRFGFDPRNDIQVLAPMHRGDAGVSELNRRLQAALNPPAPGKAERALSGGRTFRVGDRVMQTRNAYDRDVFNGDIGRITRIDVEGQTLAVDFDGREVEYDWSTVDELLLAYCCSVHKSQGSEYPAVVVPVLMQHFRFLQRNLFYTAVTRAKKVAVLVGSRKAIAIALKNNEIAQRWTALDWRLR